MAAKTSWHRYGTKLRHRHPICISSIVPSQKCPWPLDWSQYISPLILFSSLFPYSSPPLLIFSSENRLALFPGRMSLRRLNPALVFLCLFCVAVHFFWLANACFCRVTFSFFSIPSQDTGLGKRLRNIGATLPHLQLLGSVFYYA